MPRTHCGNVASISMSSMFSQDAALDAAVLDRRGEAIAVIIDGSFTIPRMHLLLSFSFSLRCPFDCTLGMGRGSPLVAAGCMALESSKALGTLGMARELSLGASSGGVAFSNSIVMKIGLEICGK